MLDLGGGPGTHAIHFCLKHPDLRATVFDLPTTRPFAEETIRKAALADRIGLLTIVRVGPVLIVAFALFLVSTAVWNAQAVRDREPAEPA